MLKFAANLSFLFPELRFRERFQAARNAGFEGCEFLFPYEFEPKIIAEIANAAGIKIVLFNLSPGVWSIGERGLAALQGREAEFERSVENGLRYAKATGVTNIHIMSGIADNDARAQATYLRNIDHAARRFANDGITALIEPINPIDMPGYFLNRVDQALTMIETLGQPNVKLQYDVYHRAMSGQDILEGLTIAAPVLGHIQIAGVAGRHEPDENDLPFNAFFEALEAMNYQGWIGCEYRPKGDTVEGLVWRDRALNASNSPVKRIQTNGESHRE